MNYFISKHPLLAAIGTALMVVVIGACIGLLLFSLVGCEESQSSIDIRKERALTGKEKEAREQHYRDEAAAHEQAKREGSSSSMSGAPSL